MVVVDPRITVKTERLLLRPLKIQDADDVFLMRRHPEVMKHTSLRPSDDLETTKAWIQGCHDSEHNWNFAVSLLEPHDGPQVIGLIGAVRAPEVGYMFNASYWGRGYATEALRAFMPLFFEHYSGKNIADYRDEEAGDASNGNGVNGAASNEKTLAPRYEFAEALTDPDLLSSQNVLAKVGFKLHERKERDFENPVLGWRDTLVFRLYRSAE
ncbi:hypothetical protein yc1106_04832 [Curvularia clavata]|uniref:N-acetyltransferase domain-containing protein n=1 Tax=Curvularia clavata TaxID=95742 RepID=A0A9Q9DRJ4_CURCL|nr:hypothetical protein yc1106_04832 [Curvularia clavata]